jgi:hypothetical protein
MAVADARLPTFVAVCPVPTVQRAVTRHLCRRGLVKALAADNCCVVQWAPFSRIDWAPVLDGKGALRLHAQLAQLALRVPNLCVAVVVQP